ncbi:ankyrin repeat domain-containing protein [Paenibacillus sp. alder61]|uniref:ankyrin repeat domain-containing protein n=1 Tax=Paenibacillus TaxID=44249 RepID=UPI00147965F1|nr:MULTISPECIES: ankyrin repeat domain-containing protein [Paenibacillus]MCA1295675.1 ankyrin repeat domain-containing protein [Paenibacillus sp. alder61]
MAEYYRDGTFYSLHHFENAQNIGWIYGTKNYDKGNVTNEKLNNAVFESGNQFVKLLLSKNIMIDVSSPKRNPLFTAIRKGNYEASYLLLENGIDVNVKYTNEFMKNMDAITLAKHYNQESIARLIAGYI